MIDISLYEPLCKILDIQVSELLYEKRLTTEETTRQGEQSAFTILATKKHLETLSIFIEILVLAGIITITFSIYYFKTSSQCIFRIICMGICISIKSYC